MTAVRRRALGRPTRTSLGAAVVAALALTLVAGPSRAEPSPPTLEQAGDRTELGLEAVPTTVDAPPAPDRVLVRFRAGSGDSARRSALAAVDSSPAGAVGRTGFVAVDTPAGEAAAVAAELADDPRVAEVQVDHVRTAAGVERWVADPYVGETFPYLELAALPSAWETADGSGVTVAILDSAVRTSHEELRGRVVPGWDAIDGDGDASGQDWHGTIVAGVAAGGANGVGMVGAAYGASVMPVRVLDSSGVGTDMAIAQGVDWASSHGADVINLSLGGPEQSPILRSALATAVARGSVVVVAAGNSGNEVLQYPAAYAAEIPGVLSVSSVEDDGWRIEGGTGSSSNDAVSIAAPGRDIVGPSYANDSLYVSGTGTSLAAPLVSGAAALVLQRNASLAPAEVAARLTSTARDAGPRGTDPFYGAGILDAGAALGQTPAVPLDRVGDDGRSDDFAADAVPVALGATHTVALRAEGDTDWIVVDGTQAGVDYEVRQSGPARGVVFDADGHELGAFWGSLRFRTAGERVYVKLWAPSGVRWSDAWGVHHSDSTVVVKRSDVQRAPDAVRFGAGKLMRVGFLGTRQPSLADVTGDGVLDVVAGGKAPGPGGLGYVGRLSLNVGRADGTFSGTYHVNVPSGFWEPSPVVADLDGDSVPEVVAAGETEVSVVSAAGGTWAQPVVLASGLNIPGNVAVADVDSDGDLDILVGSQGGLVLLRSQGGSYGQEQVTSTAPGSIAVVQLDGAFGPDVLLGQGKTLLQQADGTFAPGPVLSALTGPTATQVADLDADGQPDLVATKNGATTIVVYGTAGGVLSVPQSSLRSTTLELLRPSFGDINGDGRLDLINPNYLVIQHTDGSFGSRQYVSTPWGSSSFGWSLPFHGDGDGRLDLLASDGSTHLAVLSQIDVDDAPGELAWVWGVTPQDETSGVAARPTVTVTTPRELDPAAVTSGSVRLVAADGKDVPAHRTTDVAAGTISLVPDGDLVTGGHYEIVLTGLRDADGATMQEVARSWFTVGAAGERFTPVDPYRVLDTRETGEGAVRPGSPVDLDFSDLPTGTTSVVLNVTAAAPLGPGFLRVFPVPASSGTPEPDISNLNVAHGVDQPNLVTVKLGKNRKVRISTVWTTTHVVADISGYYSVGGATAYVPMEPKRVMDLRTGEAGGPKGILHPGRWVDLKVAGVNGVPADATAVVLNVTGANPPGRTVVRVFPTPEPFYGDYLPSVSNLNLMPGRDQPNLVTVKVGWGGKVRFYTHASDVMLVADLAGYFAPEGQNGFTAMDPVRLADTRTGLGLPGGRMFPEQTRTLTVAGAHGIPADATAAVFNVTGARPGYLTVIRVFPAGPGPVPSISNLNLIPGRDDPNMVISRIGQAGGVSFYSHSAVTDLVVDVGGYFRTWR